jgi:hypothetical protein
MANTRDITSLGVWAENAETTIPLTPVEGVAYRNESLTKSQNEAGQLYKSILNSADLNQIMYLITSLQVLMEKQGVLGWSNQVDYDPLPAACSGSDLKYYTALQPSGPNTLAGVRDPISEPLYWQPITNASQLELDLSSQTPGNEGAQQVGTTNQTVQSLLDFLNQRATKLHDLRLIASGVFNADGLLVGNGFNILNNQAEKLTSQGYNYYRIFLQDQATVAPKFRLPYHINITPIVPLDPEDTTRLLPCNKSVITGPWQSSSGFVIDGTNSIKIYFTDPYNINIQRSTAFSFMAWTVDIYQGIEQ